MMPACRSHQAAASAVPATGIHIIGPAGFAHMVFIFHRRSIIILNKSDLCDEFFLNKNLLFILYYMLRYKCNVDMWLTSHELDQ